VTFRIIPALGKKERKEKKKKKKKKRKTAVKRGCNARVLSPFHSHSRYARNAPPSKPRKSDAARNDADDDATRCRA
jgi:hypothetical protein